MQARPRRATALGEDVVDVVELPKDLQAILTNNQADRCRDYFAGMPEAQRRALAPACIDWLRGLDEFLEFGKSFRRNPLLDAASIAVFSTATHSELEKLGWRASPFQEDAFWILQDRKPEWIDRWVRSLLDGVRYWNSWHLVRQLIRAGLCQTPDHDNFVLGMIRGLRPIHASTDQTIRDALLEDPQLLESSFWRLLELEGGGENSLANYDQYSRGPKWLDTVVDMARRGELSRERLLDASLDALARDFAAYRARWFSKLHEALEPTLEERVARAPRYLDLLQSTVPPIVAFAFKFVRKLDSKHAYPADELLVSLRAVTRATAAGLVRAALKLATRAFQRDRSRRAELGALASIALGHEDPRVQEDALTLLEKHLPEPPDPLRTECLDRIELLAAEHRGRLEQWAGASPQQPPSESPTPTDWHSAIEQRAGADPQLLRLAGLSNIDHLTAPAVPISAIPYDGSGVPRLRAEARLAEIRDLNDLVATIAQVLEDPLQISATERCVEAMCLGLGHDEPDFARRVDPVRKRARKHLEGAMPFTGDGPHPDFCAFVVAWAERARVHTPAARETADPLFAFLSRRMLGLAQRVGAAHYGPSIGAATHEGGWIDPRVFARRLRAIIQADAQPVPEDLILALLRLAPEGRAQALSELPSGKADWLRASRYALGDPNPKPSRDLALWLSAVRSLQPTSTADILRRRDRALPNGVRPATYHASIQTLEKRGYTFRKLIVEVDPRGPRTRPVETPAVHLLRHLVRHEPVLYGWEWPEADRVVWPSTLWPAALENYFAIAASAIGNNLDWTTARWHHRHYLLPLLDPNVPLTPMATVLLTLALGAKESGESGLAIDAAIATIEDGRLDGSRLGRRLHAILLESFAPAKRYARTLAEVARVSELHAEIVRDALEHALQGDNTRMPRDLNTLLDLLLELSIRQGAHIRTPATRAFFESITGSGRSATTARKLLRLTEDVPLRTLTRTAALGAMVEGRCRRLDGWIANAVPD